MANKHNNDSQKDKKQDAQTKPKINSLGYPYPFNSLEDDGEIQVEGFLDTEEFLYLD